MNEYEEEEEEARERQEFIETMMSIPGVVVIPAPPEHLTPRMAQVALRRLSRLDQELGLETVKVMLGVFQLDRALGQHLVNLFPRYFGPPRDGIKDIIDALEGRGQEEKHD